MGDMKNRVSSWFEKLDDKVTQKKLQSVIEKIKNSDSKDLAKLFQQVDVEDVSNKLDSIDIQKLQELKFDKSEIMNLLSSPEVEGIVSSSKKDSQVILDKIKTLLERL